MNRTLTAVNGLLLVLLLALSACGDSTSSSEGEAMVDAGSNSTSAATTTQMDTGATTDAQAANPDTSASDTGETNEPDVEADSSVPDTTMPDTSMADTNMPDVSDQPDAAPDTTEVPDEVTYTEHVQPILEEHCTGCHIPERRPDLYVAGFGNKYEATQEDSTLCPGELVGECVLRALQNQEMEGERCRTYVVEPFHREGWICMDEARIAVVAAWVEGGMLE